MFLESLYLRNFRNIEEAHVDFAPALNIFCGLNAQGKTNLLEAIGLVSTGRSFRTQHLGELIREGSPFFFIEAQVRKNGVVQVMRLSFDGQSRRVECNHTAFSSFQPLLGLLPSILYAPCDSELISGSPAARRRFLNLHLAQSDPLYVHHLIRFGRAVKQRNSLLRVSVVEGIECWEQEMALSAAYLTEKRRLFVDELNGYLKSACESLSGEAAELNYVASSGALYLTQLQKNRARERQLGLTLTGPHRDDFELLLEKRPSRLYASEGQKRTAIAALRLAEWRRLKAELEFPPLFAVDDLELHLDHERQRLFRDCLAGLGQVFITTPQMEPEWPAARKLRASAGKIEQI